MTTKSNGKRTKRSGIKNWQPRKKMEYPSRYVRRLGCRVQDLQHGFGPSGGVSILSVPSGERPNFEALIALCTALDPLCGVITIMEGRKGGWRGHKELVTLSCVKGDGVGKGLARAALAIEAPAVAHLR